MEQLISESFDINKASEDFIELLHTTVSTPDNDLLNRACYSNNVRLVEKILQVGAKVNLNTAFVTAFENNNREIQDLLINAGAKVTKRYMFTLSRKGDLKQWSRCLEHNYLRNPKLEDCFKVLRAPRDKLQPFLDFLSEKYQCTAEQLLDAGWWNIGEPDLFLYILEKYSTELNLDKIVKRKLVKNTDRYEIASATPLKYLLEQGLNPNLYIEKLNITLLGLIIKDSFQNSVKLLIQYGVDVNAEWMTKDGKRQNALSLMHHKHHIYQYLQEQGAQPLKTDPEPTPTSGGGGGKCELV